MAKLSEDSRRFHSDLDIDIDQFAALCEQSVAVSDYPLCESITQQVPIYSGDDLRVAIARGEVQPLQSELARVLETGPGVFVVRKAYANTPIIEQMSVIFAQLLEQQRDIKAADHFAAAGANGRVWNVFEKSARADPEAFIHYYKNPILQLVSQAWLGPHYQITAQLNIIYPGGLAQQPHRDYHLGFQENHSVAQFPAHVHKMSQYLTLQGGIAHSEVPIESGPTQLLPFSQQYNLGYLAWRDAAFISYFATNKVQLALNSGDALFFNPALFHAGGNNCSKTIERSVNLLQISSAFAKPMETVESYAISALIYPHLQSLLHPRAEKLSTQELNAIINAGCEGYSFPSNLDTDPPGASMAPQTAAQLTLQALNEHWPLDKYQHALNAHQKRRLS